MTQPLVHAVNVSKSFHHNQVLKGIDLDVDEGRVVCLLGPSGSGKTTFLRCINQLETIDGGRIWVDGDLMGYAERDGKLHRLPNKQIAAQRREIGMVFQRSKGERSSCWSASDWLTAARRTRRSCRADSSSGWRSRGRWRCSPS
jgi:ABC-type histidine transport system ATPase subunit